MRFLSPTSGWLTTPTYRERPTPPTPWLTPTRAKAIKVEVTFTDDAGYDESLTSEATEAVAATPTPGNTPATGAPTISGTARAGEVLEVDTSGIADEDGLANVSFTYQWLADDSDISGATSATYTPVAEDEGKAIKVRVSFIDDAGNGETLTSEPTAVAAAALPPPPDNLRAVTQKSGAVELTWDAPQEATVTGYRIERRPTGGSPQRSTAVRWESQRSAHPGGGHRQRRYRLYR